MNHKASTTEALIEPPIEVKATKSQLIGGNTDRRGDKDFAVRELRDIARLFIGFSAHESKADIAEPWIDTAWPRD
ncbi:MAG: hypothetical protein U1D30_25370 [Planctomycetota bacterium]